MARTGKRNVATVKKAKDAVVYDRAADNWYVDPPSVADALFRVERFQGSVTDPCAGMGNIVRMAARSGHRAQAFDATPRPQHFRTMPGVLFPKPVDFLSGAADQFIFENIVFNPPYGEGSEGRAGARLEELFIDRALHLARGKVAAVLRLGWIAPRVDWLRSRGCIRIWVLSPRPSMLPGEQIVGGDMPSGGAVDYAWFVFLRGADIAPTVGVASRVADLDKSSAWTWRRGARPE